MTNVLAKWDSRLKKTRETAGLIREDYTNWSGLLEEDPTNWSGIDRKECSWKLINLNIYLHTVEDGKGIASTVIIM